MSSARMIHKENMMTISSNGTNEEDTILAQTENYIVMESLEEDGPVYHVDFGTVTLHFFEEEYLEFIDLIKQLKVK
jgi:hypothetical protein